MSLLIQALKKAEEDKRRRAALTSGPPEDATPAGVAFPALDLVDDELKPEAFTEAPLSAVETATIAVTEASDWDFVPLEVAVADGDAPADVMPELATVIETEAQFPADIRNLTEITPQASEVEPLVVAEIVALETAPEIPTVVSVEKSIADVVSDVATPPTAAAPTSAPAQPQALAKSLFAKSKKGSTRGLLPWLLLGAGLLLAGMVAWFAWQYRQLTQPIPKIEVREPIAAVVSPVVDESRYVAEAIVSEGLDVNTAANTTATETDKPPPQVMAKTADKVVSKPSSAAKAILDSRDLNPPLKFVRQPPQSTTPEPVLLGWQLYQNGDFERAELFYRKALQADPRQRDALLGLAAIAQQRGDHAAAAAMYQRVLRENPQDEAAKAAVLLLNSAQMPEHEAVQLEQSGKSDPMALGQYFAAQQRWSQAQEQFFLAYSANPNSADAALNLAVSLDHLKQTALAKTYYRKALQTKESIHFDRNKVEQRLAELDATSGLAP